MKLVLVIAQALKVVWKLDLLDYIYQSQQTICCIV